jgi:hypothetical protein
MSTEVRYIVRRPFKYDGTEYKIGDEWEPTGKRIDKTLLESDRWLRIERQTKSRHQRKVNNE